MFVISDPAAFALGLSALAGLSTGIGSLAALFIKKENPAFRSLIMSFSAGVMAFGSLAEILAKSRSAFSGYGGPYSLLIPYASFFGGVLIMRTIERFIPDVTASDGKELKTGAFTALAVAIHNFPEGIATFISAFDDTSAAFAVAFAVALHNIPEGIAAFMPVYYSTKSKRKAFLWSFFSGVAEPLGALLGYLVLIPIMSDAVFGIMFGAVAGIMAYISFAALLPDALSAEKEGASRLRPAVPGFIAGMAVMASSLVMFEL
ncbi:MAG: zinc transporter ZupT [Clostridia bacterium]|nr:zinc transporter ZupT [Clostridia bacterium]